MYFYHISKGTLTEKGIKIHGSRVLRKPKGSQARQGFLSPRMTNLRTSWKHQNSYVISWFIVSTSLTLDARSFSVNGLGRKWIFAL